ncbi:MAG: (2Fe-2S)-binding protein [Candidatus Riflebacteria bacterium]|nr:(2Fe-2S)-binding protein [Candidatus Riflebacteria bacterium]
MNRILLDGKEVEFSEGQRILEVAAKIGVEIPVLCYSPTTQCGGRCMVCAVLNLGNNSFVPACTTRCVREMNLNVSSPEVQTFRKNAIELLLSEHQGACEAPCRLVCPQYIDFPNFLSNLKSKFAPIDCEFNPEICEKCGGRCEKACRRGRLDKAIKIVELLRIKGTRISGKVEPIQSEYQHYPGQFSREQIIDYFIDSKNENSKIKSLSEIETEAARCLQCSCSSKQKCFLRNLATRLGASQEKFRNEETELPRPVRTDSIIFYPGKCIKCHRCIELGKRLKPGAGPVMCGRGKYSIVDAPINSSFQSAFAGFENQFVEECPTGALTKVKSVIIK